MPADSHADSASPVTLAKSSTAIDSIADRSPAGFGGGRCVPRRQRPTGAMNRYPRRATVLMNFGVAGVVAERLAQLRHRLRQRVVGDVGAGPQRVEQCFLRHQRAGVVEQMEQQVEELGREIERAPVASTR